MNPRGWFLVAGAGGPPGPVVAAHYFDGHPRGPASVCGAGVRQGAPWTVAEHVGRVELCEPCKTAIRTGGARV